MASPATYRVVPAQGARFMIMRDDGTAILANRDFPSETVAVEALSELARENDQELAVIYRPDGKIDRVEMRDRRRQPRLDVKLTLTIWPELDAMIDEMATDLEIAKGEVIVKALGLLKIALDAKKVGKKLIILDEKADEEEEITGF